MTQRRSLLLGGAAAVAALGGFGWARWRERQGATPQALLAQQLERLWSLTFEQPEGGTLALSSLRGRPLLLNFWATWCPPCIKEMPLLGQFQSRHGRDGQGWQVVGLAVDNVEPVRSFLKRAPAGFPVGIAGFNGLELAFELGNETRQLPFSVILDRQGRLLTRKLGAFSEEELARWADKEG